MIVSWNTTNVCNMYCSHCYRDAGVKAAEELSTAEAKTLIEQISAANFKIMIFSGGEPFMRQDIFDLLQYATDCKLIPVMGTNGTLITRDVAKKLKTIGVRGVGISLDLAKLSKRDLKKKVAKENDYKTLKDAIDKSKYKPDIMTIQYQILCFFLLNRLFF